MAVSENTNETHTPCCIFEQERRDKIREQAMGVAKKLLKVAVLLGFLAYAGCVVYLNARRAALIYMLVPIALFVLLNIATNGKLALCSNSALRTLKKSVPRVPKSKALWIRRVSTVAAIVGILVFLVLDIWDDLERWRPLGGLALFILITVCFSTHPTKINWVCVCWGLILQFCLGAVILRWRAGYQACRWLGAKVTAFLDYTDTGSQFVFGDKYTDHAVVFKILPVVIFYSAIVSCLYYVGAMQYMIKAIAVLIRFAQKTTPIESFATAAHIFFGMLETSVTLRPFFLQLTLSEIHAIMTSGMATVAGTVIAAYVEFGVSAEHVISASFMSAPAALAVAKLSMPETEKSKINTFKAIKAPKGEESNLLDALSVGATVAIKLIAYIVANLIAFISVLAFLDAILSYLGGLVNFPQLSFQLISSYVFMPLAAAMGVPWSEANVVGGLIGKKIVVNEFLAFADLGAMVKEGALSEKSSVLATYILCGFGSIAALGINLGCLSSAAPERRADFARLSVRSLINGNIACFMTACVAGLLYQDFYTDIDASQGVNATAIFNSTLVNNTTPFMT